MGPDRMKSLSEWIGRQYAENSVKFIFYAITLIGFAVLIPLSIAIRGVSLESILYSGRDDYFTDYFDSIYYGLNGPYMNYNVIYPALITVFYEAIGVILEWGHGIFSDGFEIRDYIGGMASMVVLIIISLTVIYFIIQKSRKVSKKEAILLFIVVALSYPMIFCIDRGNSMLYSVIFVALFLLFYDSDSKKLRFLSYIFLGIASSIKIYPLVFGLLVLKDGLEKKDMKGTLVLIVTAALIFLLPFFLTDGTPMDMLHNATAFSVETPTFGHVNIIAMFEHLLFAAHVDNFMSYRTIGSALSFVVFSIIVVSILLDKEMPKWQTVCLLAGTQVLCSSVGTAYLLLYMIIPVIFFINSNPQNTRENIVYGILFAAILFLIPGAGEIGHALSFTKGIISLVLIILILVRSHRRIYDRFGTRKETNSKDADFQVEVKV